MSMQRGGLFILGAVVIIVNLGAIGVFYANSFFQQEDSSELNLNVSGSHAVEIVVNDSGVATFISLNYKYPDWRVVRTTLIQDSLYDINGSILQEGSNTWKVEILERPCACSAIKDLYVVEGYVSADTGDLLDVSKKTVSEAKYEKTTCSSTPCH